MTAVALPAGWRLEPHATLDSTNLEAARRAAMGALHGTVVTARHQTAGRGRQGRQWEDSGDALLFSLLLRPDKPPSAAAQLSFAAAVSVGEALANAAPSLGISYKWPNDLLLSGRKACGILLESEADPAGGLAYLVVGIGINLRSAPEETRSPATSLAEEGLKVDPGALLSDICAAFERWYRRWSQEGFAPLRNAWLARAAGLGQKIDVRLPRETLTGTFEDLDEAGALMLRQTAGRLRIVSAGDINLQNTRTGHVAGH